MRKPFTASPWMQALLTCAVWALAAGSVVFWVLARPAQGTAQGHLATHKLWTADGAGLGRLLGADARVEPVSAPTSTPTSTRYALVGVLAGTRSGEGAALIAIDNQPARVYRVGSQVGEGGPYLQKLQARSAALGPSMQDSASLTLELPAFQPAKLPPASSSSGSSGTSGTTAPRGSAAGKGQGSSLTAASGSAPSSAASDAASTPAAAPRAPEPPAGSDRAQGASEYDPLPVRVAPHHGHVFSQ